MKTIELSRGRDQAVVDDEDYEYLNQWRWQVIIRGNTKHAMRRKHLYVDEDGNQVQTTIYMHRLIAERAGIDTSQLIDHIDRDGLNNQRNNLRPATKKQNAENTVSHSHNTSGHRGVSWYKQTKKWSAQITQNGKKIHLGYFSDKDEAIKERLKAEKKYWTHYQTI